MSQVPDDVLNQFKAMGFGEMCIRQCWLDANGDERLFNDYICGDIKVRPNRIVIQPQQQPIWINNRGMQNFENLIYNYENDVKAYPRKNDQFVGLKNVGFTCAINSVLQFFHSIPQIYNLLNQCHNNSDNEYGKFVLELQSLFTELTASNLDFVDPKNAVKSISWGPTEQRYIGVQQDIVEIFNIILNKLDKCIRRLHPQLIMETALNRKEQFGLQQLNQLFQIIITNDKGQMEYHSNLCATLSQQTISNFVFSELKSKIIELPSYLRILINRIQYNNRSIIKLNSRFIIDKILNLNMCLKNGLNQNQQEIIEQTNLQNTTSRMQEEIERQKSNLQNVIALIDMYEEEGIFIDLIKKFQKKKELIEGQIKLQEGKLYQLQQKINILSNQNNNRNQYRIHSIVIHYGSAQEGHNFIYIYNFYLDKWMKFNDISVRFVNENDVFSDATIYAQQVTYVDTQIIPTLKSHYEYLSTVGNIVASQPHKDLQSVLQLSDRIPQNILSTVTQKNKNNLLNRPGF